MPKLMDLVRRRQAAASQTASGGVVPAAVQVLEAKRRQEAGAALIDVREPEEWRGGHAPHAVHMPTGQVLARLEEIPRHREVLLICRSGNRSGQVQQALLARGFTNVLNVHGGMLAWREAGLPVEP
jgi:rhodanese-related sulfurtransferase